MLLLLLLLLLLLMMMMMMLGESFQSTRHLGMDDWECGGGGWE
jgi:hypothetical protein